MCIRDRLCKDRLINNISDKAFVLVYTDNSQSEISRANFKFNLSTSYNKDYTTTGQQIYAVIDEHINELTEILNRSPTLFGVNMSEMFAHAWSFNSDISKWNTSCVTDMSSMFYSAFSFNSEINTTSVQVDGIKYVAWDVKNVTDMSRMFQNNAQALNVSGWKVCNLSEFNQDISNWNTSKVTSMTYMFGGAAKFDSEINTKLVTVDESDYVAWDVANVEDMRRMLSLIHI